MKSVIYMIKRMLKKAKYVSKVTQLETALNQLRENVKHGQEISSTGSWTHDLLTDEIFLTDEVYSILGCSIDEFDGKLQNYYSFIHTDDLDVVKSATQNAQSGIEYDIEYRIKAKDKSVKYIHEKTKAIYDEHNKPVKMVGIMQDITYRKVIENNLKELGDTLNMAEKVAGVGCFKYDMLKGKLYCSEEMYSIFGLLPIDAKNVFKKLVRLLHPEDKNKFHVAGKLLLSGTKCDFESRIIQNDGSYKYIVGKGEPVYRDNQIVSIIGTIQDVTEKKLLEDKLETSYKNLARAQCLSGIGSWEMDLVKQTIYMSDVTLRIYGIEPDENNITYENFLKLVVEEDKHIFIAILNDLPVDPFDIEFRIKRKDDSIRYVHQLVEVIQDSKNTPVMVYGTVQDITEKKELQDELEKNQRRLDIIQKRNHVLLQESFDVYEILDPDGTIKYISGAVEKITGYKKDERVGKKIFEFYSIEEQKKVKGQLEYILSDPDNKFQGDAIFRKKNGEEIYIEVILQNLISDPVIKGIVVNFRDITKRVEMDRKLIYMSSHDELTGLPNRFLFKKQVEERCNNKGVFALIMIDIVGFKEINDALGFKVGDKLIKEITDRLTKYTNGTMFLSRYSIEKFCIIIDGNESIEYYESIVQEISELFKQNIRIDKYDLQTSLCMGISISSECDNNADEIINNAEVALYWAEKESKNKYKFFSTDINMQEYKLFELRKDLGKALDERQFYPCYQPIINIDTNEIIAAEALLRWNHPKWGMVPPSEFIPLAEETGIITNIGSWMLREVCRKYKEWKEKGLPLIKASINFSGVQFYENKFVENIKSTIEEFNLDPSFLIMELTESILIVKAENTIANLKELKSYGINIALDDFGTGYSSLSYLSSFNIDILKIDGSFIRDSITDKVSSIVTKSIINMAHELKIMVVAEGVETCQQLDYIKNISGILGQGFIFSKPLPAEDFEEVLISKVCKPEKEEILVFNNSGDIISVNS